MFAGIDCARGWPPTAMTSARWLHVPTQPIPLHELHATQEGIYLHPLITADTPVGGDPHPHVVSWNGRLYLEDGHHRAVRAAIHGQRTLTARVLVLR